MGYWQDGIPILESRMIATLVDFPRHLNVSSFILGLASVKKLELIHYVTRRYEVFMTSRLKFC